MWMWQWCDSLELWSWQEPSALCGLWGYLPLACKAHASIIPFRSYFKQFNLALNLYWIFLSWLWVCPFGEGHDFAECPTKEGLRVLVHSVSAFLPSLMPSSCIEIRLIVDGRVIAILFVCGCVCFTASPFLHWLGSGSKGKLSRWAMIFLGLFIITGGILLGGLLQSFTVDSTQDFDRRYWIWRHYGTASRVTCLRKGRNLSDPQQYLESLPDSLEVGRSGRCSHSLHDNSTVKFAFSSTPAPTGFECVDLRQCTWQLSVTRLFSALNMNLEN